MVLLGIACVSLLTSLFSFNSFSILVTDNFNWTRYLLDGEEKYTIHYHDTYDEVDTSVMIINCFEWINCFPQYSLYYSILISY